MTLRGDSMDNSTAETNKELVQAYYEAWEVGDPQRLAELFAEDFSKVHHDSNGEQVTVAKSPGEDEVPLVEWFGGFVEGFPDKTFEIHDIVSEGDVVMTRITATERMETEFLGIQPTGEYFDIHEFQSFRIQDGKIVEFHSVGDMLDVIEQLGAELEIKQ